jgi:hypothetical protein
MRMVFICGSLEPGKDGVGDYVRRLSEKLSRMGHDVALAALRDTYVFQIQNESLDIGVNQIPVLRFPADTNQSALFSKLEGWILKFKPDVLSLQYVPFAFHPKGLPFGLATQLKSITGNKIWHVMFHELWVGIADQSGLKEKVWGRIQRYLIRKTLKVLKPQVIHTSTAIYKLQLETLTKRITLLPLISNIPLRYPEKVSVKKNSKYVSKGNFEIVIFGGINGGGPVREFIEEVASYCNSSAVTATLILLGKSGAARQKWLDHWKGPFLDIKDLGPQSEEKVSEILTNVKFGIFTTPIALVEKSGSVSAMRDHGIHLICVSHPWDLKAMSLEKNPFHILNYHKGNLMQFLNSEPDFSYHPDLHSVSLQFIADLSANNFSKSHILLNN